MSLLRHIAEVESKKQEYIRESLPKPDLMKSPFQEKPIVDGPLPENITLLTDTHLDSGPGRLGPNVGKGFGWGALRKAYRRIVQSNTIALHTIRKNVEKHLKESSLFIHGGDITDAMTVHGVIFDLAKLEEYLRNRERNSDKNKPDNAVTERFSIWILGNHDTDFGGADFLARYPAVKMKYGEMSLNGYKNLLEHIKKDASFHQIQRRMISEYPGGIKPEDVRAIHPALRWYLMRSYFGPAIGAFVDEKKKEQVYFLDSELDSKSGSVATLDKVLKKSLGLHEKDSVLYEEILGTRKADAEKQEKLIAHLFAKSVFQDERIAVYAHDPVKMQEVLIKKYAERNKHIAYEKVVSYIQSRFTVYGGHWHTNEDGSAKKWNRKGVQWFGGVSRNRAFNTAAHPVGSKAKMTDLPYSTDKQDGVPVVHGSLLNPRSEYISSMKINNERKRLDPTRSDPDAINKLLVRLMTTRQL